MTSSNPHQPDPYPQAPQPVALPGNASPSPASSPDASPPADPPRVDTSPSAGTGSSSSIPSSSPSPSHQDAPAPFAPVLNDLPPQEISGPIPMATLITPDYQSGPLNHPTPGSLVAAGILWLILGGLLLVICGLFIAFGLIAMIPMSGTTIRSSSANPWVIFMFILTLGLAFTGTVIWIGISTLRKRPFVTTFGPIFAILLLLINLVFFVSNGFFNNWTRPSAIARSSTGWEFMALFPMMYLGLLCWLHLCKSSRDYFRAPDQFGHFPKPYIHKPSRTTLQWVMAACAILSGIIALIGWMGFLGYSQLVPIQSNLTLIFPIAIIGSVAVTWTTLAGSRISRILGIAYYSAWLLMVLLQITETHTNHQTPIALASQVLLLILIITLHARAALADRTAHS